LRRSVSVIFVLQISGLLLCLVAGSCLLAHVAPTSQCILFANSENHNKELAYGKYQYCELLGSGFILTTLSMIVVLLSSVKMLRNFPKKTPSLVSLKYLGDSLVNIRNGYICLHLVIFVILLILTITLTAGYNSTCRVFEKYVWEVLEDKLNVDLTHVRGETVMERFVDDPFFWRYAKKVTNSFGADMVTIKTPCRVMFTDPDITKLLHDDHADKFAGYYGYWYHQDIFSMDPTREAIFTNMIIELTMTASWLSSIIWLSLAIFSHILRRRIKELEIKETHSSRHSLSSSFKPISSVISCKLNSGRASSHSIASSRREVDDIFLNNLVGKRKYYSWNFLILNKRKNF